MFSLSSRTRSASAGFIEPKGSVFGRVIDYDDRVLALSRSGGSSCEPGRFDYLNGGEPGLGLLASLKSTLLEEKIPALGDFP